MAVGQRAADRLLRRLVERLPDSGADEAEREGGPTRQRLGERKGRGQRLTGRRQTVDQTDAIRLVRVDQFAGVEQLVSLRWTNESWKPKNAAASGENAELHLGKIDPRRLVHDADIAGERDLGSPAQRHTIQCRDDRDGQLFERGESHVLAGQFAGYDVLAHMQEFADVGACAERLAAWARHPDRAHRLVGRNVPAGGQKLVEGDEGGEVERRVIEGQDANAAVLQTVVDQGALGHERILSNVPACRILGNDEYRAMYRQA